MSGITYSTGGKPVALRSHCLVKFGFGQMVALKDLEGHTWPEGPRFPTLDIYPFLGQL